ncbi:MAG: hypothetical protein EXR75_13010 [Myxococcales bacterium]|nr:hypothetical protein [Myxococcales bacterium]
MCAGPPMSAVCRAGKERDAMHRMKALRWVVGSLAAAVVVGACAKAQTDFGASAPITCPAGQELCGDFCATIALDPNNCGGCFAPCKEGEVCSEGTCGTDCVGGTKLCGGLCVDAMLDPKNCGDCEVLCEEGEVCAAGVCSVACAGGTTSCGQLCIDVAVDPKNCGACGTACPAGEVCSEGVCALSCGGSTTQCGQICTNTLFDPSHCGACDMACPAGPNLTGVCAGGVCEKVCAKGFQDCNDLSGDGCEVSIIGNVNSCGACGIVCAAVNATAKCDGTACAIGQCNPGFFDCDKLYGTGCEVDTKTSSANCGACGNVCAIGQKCVGGACVVNTVNATCVDLLTTENMWGQPAKGIDLRKWTASTLHYIGCNGDGCAPASFFCNYDAVNKTLEFGSPGIVRAMVDPGNVYGEQMATSYSGCCQANQVLGLCNAPDANNNGINVNNALALCNALGYQTGILVASGPDNTCPEAHAVDATGKNWSSDYVNSDGYGRHWKCSGF